MELETKDELQRVKRVRGRVESWRQGGELK